jgi:hypothetical protein
LWFSQWQTTRHAYDRTPRLNECLPTPWLAGSSTANLVAWDQALGAYLNGQEWWVPAKKDSPPRKLFCCLLMAPWVWYPLLLSVSSTITIAAMSHQVCNQSLYCCPAIDSQPHCAGLLHNKHQHQCLGLGTLHRLSSNAKQQPGLPHWQG